MMQKSVPLVLVFFTVIGCQVNTTTGGLNSQYGIFFDQADHIKELLAKNRIQEPVGGRKDYKIDCLAAEFKDWEISWDED